MRQARKWQIIVSGLVLLAAAAGAAWAQAGSQPATPVDPVEQWIQDTKHPVSWLRWGADLRLREEFLLNAFTLDKHSPTHERNYQRYRTRVWTTITPVPDFDINARIAWEFRNYCQPDVQDFRDTNPDEAVWDILNVKWKNVLGLPLTATIGRQEVILGNGWLVLDGTPLDGSRTISFDAVRLTYDLKDIQTTIDGIFIGQKAREDMYIEPYNDQRGRLYTEQDELGAIAYVTNKSIKNTELSGYYIFKHDEQEGPTGENGQIHAFGARVVHDFTKNWQARVEFAEELGEKDGNSLCATGFNSQLTYFFRDPMNNLLHTGYEYLSGDDPGTKSTNEGFDPLWGRWPQWSELLAYTFAGEIGRPAFWTNYHRINFGHAFNPCPKLQICTDYNLLFADQNWDDRPGFSENGSFRGNHGSIIAKYKHNDHISSHVLFEVFGPGDFYTDDRNDTAVFARYELLLTW